MNIPDYTGAGVYALINTTNGKMYIGSSRNIRRRILTHKSQIKCLNQNKAMCEDIRRGHKFKVKILEEIPSSAARHEILTKETEYIKFFDSQNNGYNGDCPCSLHIKSPKKPKSSLSADAMQTIIDAVGIDKFNEWYYDD